MVSALWSFSQQSFFLDSLLKADLKKYSSILKDPIKYRFQVVYTRIDRDRNNYPVFTDHYLNLTKNYIYPASTVKLPVSILALAKLKELNKAGLNDASCMITDSAFFCQKKVLTDTSAQAGFPTLGNYIKKMFLVSDNAAFARTYEFIGFDYMHAKLNELGYQNIRLLNRLDGQCAGDTAKVTPPVYFLAANSDTIYKQALTHFTTKLTHPVKNSSAGRFHQGPHGKWLPGPRDFSAHNYMEITDLHRLMKQLVFNEFAKGSQQLPIDKDSRRLMLKALGQYPRESDFPKYDKIYYDSFKKYFIYGSAVTTINGDSLRVINIVGRAYGFLIDCAYIIDLKNNCEFLLTASVYVNENGRIGSGKYEYDQLGLPFFKDLGLSLYKYERQRKRLFRPDLEEFRTLFQKN
ncbi:MAG: serine hydrolase [Bacteroidota bacterium]